MRAFLKGLLSDPRVVELPRALWLPILYGFILPFRPRRVAVKYRKIWTAQGSPLVVHSNRLRTDLATTLAQRILAPLTVEFCMLYAKPTVSEALQKLRAAGAQRILVVPHFPQYCGATTGAVYDQVNEELRRWRWLPELRFIAEYHDHPGYIDALRASVIQQWEAQGRTRHPRHLVPRRAGSAVPQRRPVLLQVSPDGAPARGRADAPGRRVDGELPFQVRPAARGCGLTPSTSCRACPRAASMKSPWCAPASRSTASRPVEEIEMENRAQFLASGGKKFIYVPALNARPEHSRFLADLIAQHCEGWTDGARVLAQAGAARGTA